MQPELELLNTAEIHRVELMAEFLRLVNQRTKIEIRLDEIEAELHAY